MVGRSIDGQPVLLVNIDGVIRAYADWCPHQRSRLSMGSLEGRVLICASHHWQFDAVTGHGINPRDACLTSIAVRVTEGEILVDIGEAEDTSGHDRHEGKS